MFSLLLSSEEDFPIPMDTSDQDPAPGSHMPTIGTTPTSQALLPNPRVLQPPSLFLPPPPPPPIPPPPPPPQTTEPDYKNNVSSLPPQPPFTPAKQPGLLKRCDDDVQFVSEKPVKRRKLDTPAPPNLPSTQPSRTSPANSVPPPPRDAYSSKERDGEGERVALLISGHAHKPAAAAPVRGGKRDGTDAAGRDASHLSLENYVFPTSFPKGPEICHTSSPQLSPKQTPDTITPSLLKRRESQSVTSSFTRDQGPSQCISGDGGSDENVGGSCRENESSPVPVPPNEMSHDGDTKPVLAIPSIHVAQQTVPVSRRSSPQGTGFAHCRDTPAPEISSSSGPSSNNQLVSHSPSRSRGRGQDVQQQCPVPTASPTPVTSSGDYSNSWPSSPITSRQQHDSAVVRSPGAGAGASVHGIQTPANDKAWPHAHQTLPSHSTTEASGQQEHGVRPSDPGTPQSQPGGVHGQPRPQVHLRTQAQFQAQPRAHLQTRPQTHAHNQPHGQHGQSQLRMGHHPSGSGPSNGHCQICAARRQQVARQSPAAGINGGMPAFSRGLISPGSVPPPHSHAPAPNGNAGYNVVFVPTPMHGSGLPPGTQFTPHPSQPNANPAGVTGLPPHPYMLQHPQQQGATIGPAFPTQTATRAGSSAMTGQASQSRPQPAAASSQQGQPPRKFPHQEPSAGKHIIVDIADTAMQVFPFAKVAKRHNVAVDKVRSVFEAVVAVPFLRVPTDKRRAGKIGQERVKKYLAAKKELEKQAGRGTGSGEGGAASVREVARAMGPEMPRDWAHGFPGP